MATSRELTRPRIASRTTQSVWARRWRIRIKSSARSCFKGYADQIEQMGRWSREKEARYDSDNAAAVDVCYAIGPRCLGEGVLPLDLAIIKDFIRFHVAICRGRLDDEQITVDSLNTFAEWFFAEFARVTGTLIDEEDRRVGHGVGTF